MLLFGIGNTLSPTCTYPNNITFCLLDNKVIVKFLKEGMTTPNLAEIWDETQNWV
jgi:hypothetical protein